MTVISAFPQSNDRVVCSISIANSQGMTLRDYFAAKAMQAFISAYPCQGIDVEDGGISVDHPSIAFDAYEMADEMIEARKFE